MSARIRIGARTVEKHRLIIVVSFHFPLKQGWSRYYWQFLRLEGENENIPHSFTHAKYGTKIGKLRSIYHLNKFFLEGQNQQRTKNAKISSLMIREKEPVRGIFLIHPRPLSFSSSVGTLTQMILDWRLLNKMPKISLCGTLIISDIRYRAWPNAAETQRSNLVCFKFKSTLS